MDVAAKWVLKMRQVCGRVVGAGRWSALSVCNPSPSGSVCAVRGGKELKRRLKRPHFRRKEP